MSKIKFNTLCGATVEVDPRYIKRMELDPEVPIIEREYDGRFKSLIRERLSATIILWCDSSFKVDTDTFRKIGRAMEKDIVL